MLGLLDLLYFTTIPGGRVGRLYENKTKLSPTLLSWSLAELGNIIRTQLNFFRITELFLGSYKLPYVNLFIHSLNGEKVVQYEILLYQ